MKITFYLLAAGLAAALLLEVFCTLCAARASRRPAGRALLARWQREELFLASFRPRARLRLGDALAFVFIVSELGWTLLKLFLDLFVPDPVLNWLAVAQAALSCAIVLFKGLLCTEYSGRQLAMLGALMGLFSLIVPNVGSYAAYLCYPVCVAVMFKGVRLKGKLRLVLLLSLAEIAARAALSLTGVIPDNLFSITDRIGLGFSHPNALGVAVVAVLAIYIGLRYAAWRWWDTLVALAALAFLYFVPYSRTAIAVAAVMVVLTVVSRMLPRLLENIFCREALALSWPLLAAACLWMGANYGRLRFLDAVNSMLSQRLMLLHYGLTWSGWEWLGTRMDGNLTWNTAFAAEGWQADAALGLHNYHLVDMGYGFFLLMGGPLFLAVMLAGAWLTIRRLLRSGREDWGLAIMMVGFGFQLACEHILLPIIPAALLGIALFGKHQHRSLTLKKTKEDP